MFGGVIDINQEFVYYNDTWAFDTTSNKWTQLFPATSPPAIESFRMVYDPTTGQIVLFGGFADIFQTWVYGFDSGQYNWKNVTPGYSPPGRDASAMAFDPCTGKVIIFGGYGGSGDLNDTWAYDATTNTWTNLNPSNPPSVRDSCLMVFDPNIGQIVLFGGYYNGNNLNDTWAFNTVSNSWHELTTTNAPSERYGYGMVFNPTTGQINLFAGGYFTGSDPATVNNETWAFDDSDSSMGKYTWTQLSFDLPIPEARQFPAMEFDPSSGQIILFGGDNGNRGAIQGTWALGLGVSPKSLRQMKSRFR